MESGSEESFSKKSEHNPYFSKKGKNFENIEIYDYPDPASKMTNKIKNFNKKKRRIEHVEIEKTLILLNAFLFYC